MKFDDEGGLDYIVSPLFKHMPKESLAGPEEQGLPPELKEQARDLVAGLIDEIHQIIKGVRDIGTDERRALDNKSYRRASFDAKTNEGVNRFLEQLRKARSEQKNVTIVRSEGMIELWVDIVPQ